MKQLPFTLIQLLIFKTVIEEGNFKKAALKLDVSQSTISFQMQNLERQLKKSLLKRNKSENKVLVTENGSLVLQYSRRILSLCEEIYPALTDLNNLQDETLMIGGSQTTGTYVLPRMIGLFLEQYPKLSINLKVDSTRHIVSNIAKGNLDLGIVGGEIPHDLRSSIEVLPYANDQLVLIASSFHPLAKKVQISKEDLYSLNYVTLQKNSTTKNVIDKSLIRNGIDLKRLKVVMELNSIEAIKNTVEAGLGLAFVSITAIQKELNLGLLKCLKIENLVLERQLLLVINSRRYQSRIVYSFIKEILGFRPSSLKSDF